MTESIERDKAVRFISKLVQLTREKKIEWQATTNTDGNVAFRCEVEKRDLLISRYARELPNPAYEAYNNPASAHSVIWAFSRSEPTKTIFRAGVTLDFLDPSGSGRSLYKLDNTTGLSDLYESAAYVSSKAEDLMDAVIAKNP